MHVGIMKTRYYCPPTNVQNLCLFANPTTNHGSSANRHDPLIANRHSLGDGDRFVDREKVGVDDNQIGRRLLRGSLRKSSQDKWLRNNSSSSDTQNRNQSKKRTNKLTAVHKLRKRVWGSYYQESIMLRPGREYRQRRQLPGRGNSSNANNNSGNLNPAAARQSNTSGRRSASKTGRSRRWGWPKPAHPLGCYLVIYNQHLPPARAWFRSNPRSRPARPRLTGKPKTTAPRGYACDKPVRPWLRRCNGLAHFGVPKSISVHHRLPVMPFEYSSRPFSKRCVHSKWLPLLS